ncbi:MAG: glycyl-radical enzyme activating protein [Clostridia bacterium]|nr:glycyl-radical enzyme activating protein [Clostridia bacterium]
MNGIVFHIQRSSIHDGPGIRTTVFLKGCPLRCFWCHNPESLSPRPELLLYPDKCIGDGACIAACPQQLRTPEGFLRENCLGCGKCAAVCYAGAIELAGETYTDDALFRQVQRDKPFYKSTGGVTFSGGEPLTQSEFVAAVAEKCKADGIHVAIDTALYVSREAIDRVLPYADLFLIDVKAATSALHREGTGVDNERILDNLRYITETGVKFWIRTPLIPGFNDSEEELAKIGALVRSLPQAPEKQELLPFHNLGEAKYRALGKAFGANGVQTPSAERVAACERVMRGGEAL